MTLTTMPDDRERLKQAVLTIRRLQEKVDSLERASREPLAIVGLGCRFPGGVTDPEAYWRMLAAGVDAISEVPSSRWDAAAYFDPDPSVAGKMYTTAGGFVADIDRFDAEFFGVSPREAVKIDPQHRLLLEVAWEALENAGIPPLSLAETRTGVFVGITGFEYGTHLSESGLSAIDAYSMTGTKLNFAAGRLSYLLGLQGPALAIDTACSSSLTAVHFAAQSLRANNCDVALVGGVNAILAPEQTIAECKAGMLSPDGRCKTFDASANGFVRGEGCGVVVLKRLRDAQAQGDPIAAVIKGSAVNQDGPSSGLTVPNRIAQETVIRAALDDAGLEPSQIDFVEAHGTGTSLGDPIEVRALANVFGTGAERSAPLKVGTVKTNIGHLESAAGIAGFIKVVLSLAHEAFPPNLHLKSLNPAVAWAEIPIEVPTTLEPWETQRGRRRGGVSSFGASGTNAHVILEEWPRQLPQATETERSAHVLTLSAKTRQGLAELACRYTTALDTLAPEQLADVCHTTNVGRSHLSQRLAVAAGSIDSARSALVAFTEGCDDGTAVHGTAASTTPKVAMLFSGQGAQHPAMGRDLYESQPTFRRVLDECNELLIPHLDQPLLDVLFADGEEGDLINQTIYTQPALFTLEYALARLWIAWGVEPVALLGHSIGEFAAACVGGMLDLPDALRLVAARGRLMGRLPAGGAMAAVFASLECVERDLADRPDLSIAAVNGPQNIVLSGNAHAIDAALSALAEQGVEGRRLEVSHAFHSPLIEPMLDEFETVAGELRAAAPAIPVISNLTGDLLSAAEAGDPRYWRNHARKAVQFERGMQKLGSLGVDAFLEVGPSSTLLGMGRLCLSDHPGDWLPSLRPGRDDWQQVNDTLARLHVSGVPIDWGEFDRDYPRQKLRMPNYPFAGTRYWFDAPSIPRPESSREVSLPADAHPLLGVRLPSPLATVQFEARLGPDVIGWLGDHQVLGTPVLSATAFVEMALTAAREVVGNDFDLEDVFMHAPLPLAAGEAKTVQLILEPPSDAVRFRIASLRAGGTEPEDWTEHVSGRIQTRSGSCECVFGSAAIAALETRCCDEVPVDAVYRGLAECGVDLGPSYRTVERLYRGDAEALGWVTLGDDAAADGGAYALHPALLDGCFHVAREALPASARESNSAPLIPIRFAKVRLHRPSADRVVVHAMLQSCPETMQAECYDLDVRITDEDHRLVAEIDGFRVIRADRAAFVAAGEGGEDEVLYEQTWIDLPLPAGEPEDQSKQWLVFGRDDGFSEAILSRLRDAGQRVWLVRPSEEFHLSEDGLCGVRPDVPEDFDRLIEGTVGQHQKPWALVHAWGVGQDDHVLSLESIRTSQAMLCQGLLHLAQSVERQSSTLPVRLLVVTQGTQGHEPSQVGVHQAPLWGLSRVIIAEQPRLNCRLVEIEQADEAAADQVIAEARSTDGENQIRLCAEGRRVARLSRLRRGSDSSNAQGRAAGMAQLDEPYRLTLGTPGLPDSLCLRPAQRAEPRPDEVEIEVVAAGLNFRDVLVALDVYQGEAGPLGGECAGRVVAVGRDVKRVALGDAVMAFAFGAMASHVVTHAELTWPVPKDLSWEQAAALPIAYLTAAYCLNHRAKMSRGDRVLVHCAAGGVGMAAVQLARRADAEVFGTAGSPEKRDLIASRGVAHVMDSRSLAFADETMKITKGAGLDIVLNSLAGEFIDKGLSLLREGGRFVEIGRTDTWSPEQVAERYNGIDYATVLLGDVCEADPSQIQSIGVDIFAAIDDGELETLPVTSFPIERAADAFRLMAQGKHTGKLVLTTGLEKPESDRPAMVSPDRAYLVTGGYGGLGLLTAQWLVDSGAGHVVLMGRSGPDDEATPIIAAMRAAGSAVSALRGDVTREEDLRQALAHIDETGRLLGGIVHAAGVLDDAVVAEQTWARIEDVLAAKVTGAWLLHDLTQDRDLDFFVLFSSASALLGSAGQAGYAAANAFLDTMARWRRAQGLVGLSLNWGPWAEAGMFAKSGQAGARTVSGYGIEALSSELCFAALTRAHEMQSGQLAVLLADWSAYKRANASHTAMPFLSDLVARDPSPAEPAPRERFKEELAAAPRKRQPAILQRRLRQEVAQVLGSDSTAVGTTVGFRELGMDSLMSVELRNRLDSLLDCSLVSTIAFDYPNIDALSDYLLREHLSADPESIAAPELIDHDALPETTKPDAVIEDLLEISNEAAEELLLAELEDIRRADRNE